MEPELWAKIQNISFLHSKRKQVKIQSNSTCQFNSKAKPKCCQFSANMEFDKNWIVAPKRNVVYILPPKPRVTGYSYLKILAKLKYGPWENIFFCPVLLHRHLSARTQYAKSKKNRRWDLRSSGNVDKWIKRFTSKTLLNKKNLKAENKMKIETHTRKHKNTQAHRERERERERKKKESP